MKDLNFKNLRALVREMLEDDIKEFSSVAGLGSGAGFTIPLASKKRRRSKRIKNVNESNFISGQVVGDYDFTFNNYFVYEAGDSYAAEEHVCYYNSVEALSKYFAGATNPFGTNRDSGIKKSEDFLKGKIKYPHEV